MSKKQILNKQKTIRIPADGKAFKKLKFSIGMLIGVFAFLLYAQTISYDYVNDDIGIITKNEHVKSGLSGIPIILKSDYWSGSEWKIQDALYRPASLIMFAIEWQFFTANPHIGHFINVLLYAITCWLLFLLLCKLFEKQNIILPFICCIIYVAHPIHTEVVCNIKSRDEILCFLFGILAMYFLLRYLSDERFFSLIWGTLFYLLSMLSKETGVSFLILIPLMLYVFRAINTKKLIVISGILLAITMIYFLIRYLVLSNLNTIETVSILNKTFSYAPNFIGKEATAFFILLKYVLLLIFPHPLVYDYSYNQIPVKTFKDIGSIIGLILYFAIGIYSIIKLKSNSRIAFAIIFYLISLAAVSNVFIIIGSAMNERFLYIPSLGFCLLISFLLMKVSKNDFVKYKYITLFQFFKVHSKILIMTFILIGIYSIKTYTRSQDWQSEEILFGHDILNAENSSRAHFHLANTFFYDLYPKAKDQELKNRYYDTAIIEYKKANSILPDYFYPAYLNLGVIYQKTKQYKEAINIIDSALKMNPENEMAYNNKGAALYSLKQFDDAIEAFQKAISINPKFAEAYKNLGGCYLNLRQTQKAIIVFNKALDIEPDNSQYMHYLGVAYQKIGDTTNARTYLEKANRISSSQQR